MTEEAVELESDLTVTVSTLKQLGESFYGQKENAFEQRKLTAEDYKTLREHVRPAIEGLRSERHSEECADLLQYFIGFSGKDEDSEFGDIVGKAILENLSVVTNRVDKNRLKQSSRLLRLVRSSIARKSLDRELRKEGRKELLQHTEFALEAIKVPIDRDLFVDVVKDVLAEPMFKEKEKFEEDVLEIFLDPDCESQEEFLARLATDKLSDRARRGRNMLKRFVERKYEVSGSEIVEAWEMSGDFSSRKDIFTNNLYSMRHVEEEQVGIVRYLVNTHNIKAFGRYPKEMLVEQFNSKDKDTPYGVLILPRADYNGAFYSEVLVLSKLKEELEGRRVVRIFEADSSEEVRGVIVNSAKKYGKKNKISFAIIAGHGSPFSLNLGSGGSVVLKTFADERAKRLKNYFVEDPSIVLFSCSTGNEDETSLAREISKLGATVTGPNGSSKTDEVMVETREDGEVFLTASYSGTHGAVYKDGELIRRID